MEKEIKSTQEQAVAAWINYLNQLRLNSLLEALKNQDTNLQNALDSLNDSFHEISELIASNRGGEKGLHGFIAEIAQCGIGNAREQVNGDPKIYEWVNDNGPDDLFRNGLAIQQKFCNGNNRLSLDAIAEHLKKYPDYLDKGKKYQIPRDHYEKIQELLNIPEDVANKLPTDNGEFSLKQWKYVRQYFNNGDIRINDIEPSDLSYNEVQKGTIANTYKNEEDSIRKTDKNIRDSAYEESKPNIQEGAKAALGAALIEGGTSFAMGIAGKLRDGKHINELEKDDWNDILKDTAWGSVKGGVRGVSIYMLTNYTATPAAVASSIVTVSFGVAQQAHLFRNGQLSEIEFISNSEMLCLDATISALSSFIGQALIPVPVLGAVIGNSVGQMMYKIAKDSFNSKEQEIIQKYVNNSVILDDELEANYSEYIKLISEEFAVFMSILENAFAPDIEMAFHGSVKLAQYCGVPSDEILDSMGKIESYFMD